MARINLKIPKKHQQRTTPVIEEDEIPKEILIEICKEGDDRHTDFDTVIGEITKRGEASKNLRKKIGKSSKNKKKNHKGESKIKWNEPYFFQGTTFGE